MILFVTVGVAIFGVLQKFKETHLFKLINKLWIAIKIRMVKIIFISPLPVKAISRFMLVEASWMMCITKLNRLNIPTKIAATTAMFTTMVVFWTRPDFIGEKSTLLDVILNKYNFFYRFSEMIKQLFSCCVFCGHSACPQRLGWVTIYHSVYTHYTVE